MRRSYRPIIFAMLMVMIWPNIAFSEDQDTIRGVISGQIEAFKQDDAKSAYAFAAPIIQQLFPDEDIFISMVKKGYPQVYRPKTYQFGTLERMDNAMAQTVILTDAEGRQWRALYTLERQSDGQWKISGCRILKSDITS